MERWLWTSFGKGSLVCLRARAALQLSLGRDPWSHSLLVSPSHPLLLLLTLLLLLPRLSVSLVQFLPLAPQNGDNAHSHRRVR